MAKNDATKTEVPEAPEVPKVPEEPAEKMVTIRLPITRENSSDVFVRVNRRTWLIKRGETVTVPECVVEVLKNAESAMLEAIQFQTKNQKD